MDIIMDNQIWTKVNSMKHLGIIVHHKLIGSTTLLMSKLRFPRESTLCIMLGNIFKKLTHVQNTTYAL